MTPAAAHSSRNYRLKELHLLSSERSAYFPKGNNCQKMYIIDGGYSQFWLFALIFLFPWAKIFFSARVQGKESVNLACEFQISIIFLYNVGSKLIKRTSLEKTVILNCNKLSFGRLKDSSVFSPSNTKNWIKKVYLQRK